MYTSRYSKEFFLPLPSHWELLSQSPKNFLLPVLQAIPTVTLLLWNKSLKLVYSWTTPILWFEGKSSIPRSDYKPDSSSLLCITKEGWILSVIVSVLAPAGSCSLLFLTSSPAYHFQWWELKKCGSGHTLVPEGTNTMCEKILMAPPN